MNSIQSNSQLINEAHWIHQALFSLPCPQEIETLYIEAHSYFQIELNENDHLWIQTAIEKKLSPVNLEYFKRFTAPGNPLSKKMKMLIYFCEMDPSYRDYFRNSETVFFKAFFKLGAFGILAALRFLMGWASSQFYLSKEPVSS